MILTLDGYIAAQKQKISYIKTVVRATVATGWFSLLDVAGNPSGGSFAIGNTVNGIVPVAGNPGYPPLNAFGVGNQGYLTNVEFGSSIACRLMLIDRLYNAGAFAFNSNVI